MQLHEFSLLYMNKGKDSKNFIVLKGFDSWLKFACVVGVILNFAKSRREFMLSDLRDYLLKSSEVGDEERTCFEKLGLMPKVSNRLVKWRWKPILQLLRVLQSFRVIDVSLVGGALNCRNIRVVVLRPEWIPDTKGLECHMKGIVATWSLFLRDSLPRRLIDSLLKTYPGAEDIYVDLSGLRLTIYEQILLQELRDVIQNWNTKNGINYIGTAIGRSNIKNLLKPLDDAAMLITLASVSGIIVPMHNNPQQSVNELTKEFIATKTFSVFRRKFVNKIGLGLSWTESIKSIEARKVSDDLPQWQKTVFRSILQF
ncbi:MAG: hypothetical protein QW607_02990 [Desulfurococcaceae archaeon]